MREEGRASAYSGMPRPAETGTTFYGHPCEAVDRGAEPGPQLGNRHLLLEEKADLTAFLSRWSELMAPCEQTDLWGASGAPVTSRHIAGTHTEVHHGLYEADPECSTL